MNIAREGARAVAELRVGATWIDRRLLVDEPELLDLDETPPAVRQRILDDVNRLTWLLQLQRFWMRRIGRMIVAARRRRGDRPVRVLDVGAGRGGLLLRLSDWARRRGIPVELYGLDADSDAVEGARRAAGAARCDVALYAGDARALPFQTHAMDVVATTLMLHHLPPGDVACVLHELDRVAATNLFAFDLRRSLAALPALWALLRLGPFGAPTRHDSLVSLRKAYSVTEIAALCGAAGTRGLAVEKVTPAFYAVSRT